MQTDTAVILAGGRGSRLKPYTTVLPKPLMPVGERPILEIVVQQLAHHGIRDLVFAVSQRDALIRTFFGDGSAWDVRIRYSREDKPLSTIGPLRLMEDDLPDSFLVMNGDLLTDLDYRKFLDAHRQRSELLSVAVHRRRERIDYGVIDVDDDHRAVGFREKPSLDLWVSMGIYAMDRDILQFVPDGESFGFDDLMHTMLDRDRPVATCPHDGIWHDIGRPADFERASRDFEEQPGRFLPQEKPTTVLV